MTELSEAEWEREAEDLLETIHDAIGDSDNEMISEVLACVMADMIDTFPPDVGIPLMFAFMGEVLEKAYGVEVSATNIGRMQ